MAYSDTQIDSIIEETLAKFQHQSPRAQGGWLCDTAEEAIANAKYEANAPFVREELPVSRVTIPLKMHIGAPSEPVVAVGNRVERGDLIARIPEGKMGANIHASLDGTILAVDGQSITIQR